MAWVTQFLLGRPQYEQTFDINPAKMAISFQQLVSQQRTLGGTLKQRVFQNFSPSAKLSSSWFPKTQLDKFASLITINDSFLSFKTRDDWHLNLMPYIPATTTTIVLEQDAVTRLSAAVVAAGGTSTISGIAVYANPNGASGGVNLYSGGGTYTDSTFTITLPAPLGSLAQVYVSITFSGWMVSLQKLDAGITGGRVDLFTYDFELIPA